MKLKQAIRLLKPYLLKDIHSLVGINSNIKDPSLKQLLQKIFCLKNAKIVKTFLYWHKHWKKSNFELKVTCPMCGEVVDIEHKYCSNRCRRLDPNYKVIYRKSYNLHYDKNIANLKASNTLFGQSKHKEAMNRIYGVDNPMKSEKIKKRLKRTVKKTYGVDCTFQLDIVKQKSKQTCLNHWNTENYSQSQSFKNLFTPEFNKQRSNKYYTTMKRIGGFKGSTSKQELQLLKYIKQKFTVESPYHSDLYPFNCDFYLVDYDLYIEYQGYFTHGKEPYSSRKNSHKQIVRQLEKKKDWKSEKTLQIWTVSDPLKRKIAKQNKLKWVEFFDIEDAKRFIDLLYNYTTTHKRWNKKSLDMVLSNV